MSLSFTNNPFRAGACCILLILPYQALNKISPLKHALGVIVTAGTDFTLRNTYKKSCIITFTKYENNSVEQSPSWEAERFQSRPNIVFLSNLYSHVGLPSDLFPSDFQTKVLYARSNLSLPILLHIPRRRRWTMNFSLCDFLNRPLATCTLYLSSC